MSEKEAKKKSKEKKAAASNEPPSLSFAISRMVGVYLGALALGMTYLMAVLSGVSAPTALLRAFVVFIVFLFAGRMLGLLVGRTLENHLDPDLAPQVEREATP